MAVLLSDIFPTLSSFNRRPGAGGRNRFRARPFYEYACPEGRMKVNTAAYLCLAATGTVAAGWSLPALMALGAAGLVFAARRLGSALP